MPELQPEEQVVEQVRRYAAPQDPAYQLGERVVAEVARRRRRRAVLGSGVAAAVVIAGSVGVAQVVPERDTAPPVADRGTRSPQESGGPSAPEVQVPVGGDWRKMAPSPLSPRHGSLGVWTGDELVVVGGLVGFICPPTADCATDGEPSAEAAAYDPATDTWRTLPDAPAPVADPGPFGGSGDAITWTGEEVVVVRGERLFTLDPDGGAWQARKIVTETSDLPPTTGAAPAIVHASYDSGRRGGLTDWVVDPVAGTRTWFPEDPFGESYDRNIAWDGERFWLLSMGVEHHFEASEPSPSRLAVLDGNEWRVVVEETPGVVYGQKITWDGERLVIAPQGDNDGHWFDPETETWGRLPAVGSDAACPLPAAGVGQAWTAAEGGVLVAGEEVLGVPRCDQTFATASLAVWAGEELLVWGGAGPAGRFNWQVSNAGLRWRPPAPQ